MFMHRAATDRIPRLGSRRGVGLVEVLISTVILGVVVAVAIPSMSDLMERRRVIAAAGELASMMNFAKAEVNAIGDVVDLHMEDDPRGTMSCAAVATQTAIGRCRCYDYRAASPTCTTGTALALRIFQLPRDGRVQFSASATQWPAGNEKVITLHKNQYPTDFSGVGITVEGLHSGAKLRVEYNDVGRVRTCSPDASLSGYVAC